MIRGQVRGLIEEMIRSELDATLSRPRYGRRAGHSEGRVTTAVVTGHRHGSRVRTLTGTFGKTEIAVPRARLNGSGGKTTEWKSHVLRNYQRGHAPRVWRTPPRSPLANPARQRHIH
jgi:transposase-like protein